MKNKFSFFFCFFQILLLISQINSQENETSNNQSSINYLNLFLHIFEELETDCYVEVKDLLNQSNRYEKDKTYPWLTDYLGKGINDIGDEAECLNSIKQNTTFFMFNFHDLNISNILKTDQPLTDFLSLRNFTFGFCIVHKCRETFPKYVRVLLQFINYINNDKEPNKDLVTYYESNKIDNESSNVYFTNNLDTSVAKICFISIIGGLIFLKIVGGLIRIVFIPKGYDKYIVERMNKLKKLKNSIGEESENLEEKSKLSSKNEFSESLIQESSSKEYNPLFDFSDKLPKLTRFLRAFDLFNDFKYLTSIRNRYYNDSGLEILVFNRAAAIFALIFSDTISSLIILPSEEIINPNFFGSWMNIFYRLSNNALVSWIFLEGAYTTYKLLSYISKEMFIYLKKEDRRYINWKIKLLKIFGKFLILLIPKYVVFVLIYYFIYYKIEDYRFATNKPATFQHTIVNIFKENITCSSFGNIFDPGLSNNIDDYNKCFEFTHFYKNMFICIIIFMIITYLFFVVKNKIFEFVVIGVNFAIFLFSVLLIIDDKSKIGDYFLEYHIMGQKYSHKILFHFIGFYSLGFIFGFLIFNNENLKGRINRLIYEYNKGINSFKIKIKDEVTERNDSIDTTGNLNPINNNTRTDSFSSNNSNNEDSTNYYKKFLLEYYPLAFLKKLIKYIYKLKFWTKISLIIVGILLIVLIDFLLLIFVLTRRTFKIDMDLGKRFLFRYEKHIFIVIFIMINAILLTLPKKSKIKSFMGSRIFVAISRLGFLITLISSAFTYFSYLIFSIKAKLYVPTFVVISFGNFLLFFVVCSFIIFILEFPLRILIKKILRIQSDKERSKENIIS